MDPNETLRMIDEFIRNRETGEDVDIWCQDLWDWFAKGGFQPDWSRYHYGTEYYQARAVHHARGERV